MSAVLPHKVAVILLLRSLAVASHIRVMEEGFQL